MKIEWMDGVLRGADRIKGLGLQGARDLIIRHIICFITIVMFVLISSGMSIRAEVKEVGQEQQTIDKKTNENATRPWWLGDLITILGIFASTSMLVYQLSRQHKNELRIQKENYREQLRLKIYQDFSRVIEAVQKKTIDAAMYVSSISTDVNTYVNQVNSDFNPTPLRSRAIEFNNKHIQASHSIVKLIRLFEKYEIVSPELDIFKLAVNVATYDMVKDLPRLYSFLVQMLPMDGVDNSGNVQLANVRTPTAEQIAKLDTLVGAYKSAARDLDCYLFDLNVELQNIFLRRLFDNKVKRRKPIDPKMLVITTESEDVKTLRKYFEEETAWGKNAKQTKGKGDATFFL